MPDSGAARQRVLVVDDDDQIRRLLARILGREGYRCAEAAEATEARRLVARDGPFDLILCDVGMPGESGLELVEDLVARDAHLAAVMVTGLREVEVAEQALLVGANGYVLKPFSADDVLIAVLAALRQRRLGIDAARQLKASHEETITRLCIAVEFRDPGTGPHIERMSELCSRTARELGWDVERSEALRVASSMHDVGKIAIPDRVLLKPGPLTPEERAEMETHADVGHRILAGSRAELLQLAASVAWTHHERFDGTGYPRRLAGAEIPMEGRIAALADVYDALSSDRVYRKRFPRDEVLEQIRAGRGTHFDPGVADAFLWIVERDEPAGGV